MFKLITSLSALIIALQADGLTFVVSNDAPYGTDSQLTSACEVRYLPSETWSFHAGIDMYTPRNTKTTTPPPGQHPYNSWVYFGAAHQNEIKALPVLTTLKLDVGARGPHAQGSKVQREVHNLIGAKKINGWESETPNEFGYLSTALVEYAVLEPFPELERYLQVSIFGNAKLGSIEENYSAGVSMTLGLNVPNYHTLHVMPGTEAYYFYAAVESISVKKNRFLDGNDVYNVEKNAHVKRYDLGLHLDFKDIRVRLIATTQSKTFKTQKDRHRYATIEVGFAF